ncbi:helix-turn-helix transcriptional regulator [Erysipelotrichaceae bacterium RD49]|nr:helix-turn-helix transcriptional regulator [Erysipelotrichaceae bacterium RD49]
MTIYDNLGLFEKWLRKSYSYSLENVAHDIGISKSFLSDAERGRRLLKPEIFARFLN